MDVEGHDCHEFMVINYHAWN